MVFVGATINFHYPISHSGNKVCLCCFSFWKENTAIAQEYVRRSHRQNKVLCFQVITDYTILCLNRF